MADKHIQKQKAKTTRQLTDELNNVVERNKVLEEKLYKVEELLKKVMEKYENNSDNISEGQKTDRKDNKCVQCNESFEKKVLLKRHIKENHKRMNSVEAISCAQCGERFKENWLLEVHLKNHIEAETFECEVCDKVFRTKWRLRKHKEMHSNEETKKCHYFNNGKLCPYEEVGCKFVHTDSELCLHGNKCKHTLCSFKHIEIIAPDSIGDQSEKEILKGYENDMKRLRIIQAEFEIYNASKKCKECKFASNSHGLIKLHENNVHNKTNSYENIMEGFEIDDEQYVEVLSENIGDEAFERYNCEKCNFKNHSEGTLKVHEYDSHSVSPDTGDQ